VLGLLETAKSSDGPTLWNRPNTVRSPPEDIDRCSL
jgi:hypothetical protein